MTGCINYVAVHPVVRIDKTLAQIHNNGLLRPRLFALGLPRVLGLIAQGPFGFEMKRVVVLIDGGHLRAMSKNFKIAWNVEFIEDFCKSLATGDEELQKILFYDCKPYNGTQRLPVSGNEREFSQSSEWLKTLSCRELFAVRLGQLKFRGWTPKSIPVAAAQLSDSHFKPTFEQKGVDMRIGLDMSNIAERRIYDRILLVSGDSDMIPALKEARRAGIQVALYQLPFLPTRAHRDKLKAELSCHADFLREATWPMHSLPVPSGNP